MDEQWNKLNAILESTPDAITITDLNGKITECSVATVRIHGFASKEELIGKSSFDLIVPEEIKRTVDGVKETLEKGAIRNWEYRMLRKDGTVFDGELSVAVALNERGEPDAFIGITKDVTERRLRERALVEAEEALKISEHKYRTLFSHAVDGIFIMSLDGKSLLFNESFAKMHGYGSPKEMEHLSLSDFDTPETAKLAPERLGRLMAGESMTFEVEHYHKNGHSFPLSVSCNVVKIEGVPHFLGFHRDITEIKKKEKALRESEENLRLIYQNVDEGVIIYDTDLKYVFWNPYMEKLTGLSASDAMGKYAIDMFPHLREHGADVLLRRALAGETVDAPNMTFKTPVSGDVRRTTGRYQPYRNAACEIIGVLGIVRDTTDMWLVEKQLRESEEQFRLAFENAKDAIFWADAETGIFVNCNKSAESLLERSREEIIGQHHLIMHPPDRTDEHEKMFKQHVARQGAFDDEALVITKSGRVVPVNISSTVVTIGEKRINQGIFRDVTERKLIEKQLKESEEQFRLTFENARDAIFWVDSETGIIVNCNHSAEMLLERGREEIIGSHHTILHPPEDIEKYRGMFIDRVEKRELGGSEVEIATKSGKRIPAHIAATAIQIGERVITQGIFRNLTEIKKVQAEKDALMQQLHQSQKMEAIGQLAGGIAHDFNNILAVIIGTAEQVIKGMSETGNSRKHIDRILRVAKRARDLTMNLLTFARKEKIDIRPIRSDELIQELIDLLKRSISKKIRIRSNCSGSASPLLLDVNQMIQALLNVCINAADAMPDGGALTIACADVSLDRKECETLSGLSAGSYCRIEISDTGAGMSEEVRERIFDPFFTTKERGKGTGLGLPITLGIVQGHGGDISVVCAPGKGTSVKIFLPVAEGAAAIRETPAVEEQQAAVKGTILVVDDDRDYLDMMVEILQDNGLNTISAHGPATALELYGKNEKEIDLVILDMIMPEMGGEEVFRLLRKMNPEVKVILCSGYSRDGKAGQILNEGVSGFLQKPFDSEQLLSVLYSLL